MDDLRKWFERRALEPNSPVAWGAGWDMTKVSDRGCKWIRLGIGLSLSYSFRSNTAFIATDVTAKMIADLLSVTDRAEFMANSELARLLQRGELIGNPDWDTFTNYAVDVFQISTSFKISFYEKMYPLQKQEALLTFVGAKTGPASRFVPDLMRLVKDFI